LKTLKEKDINIVSLSLADSSDYGMLRMVVANPERALSALKESGFSAMLTDVLAVKLDHKAGQLSTALFSFF
ncbi:MAG: amino acid-binding protein, partial [Clostridia bacterium]|nr:amino acid-binding protein [Clostridia bacterium]